MVRGKHPGLGKKEGMKRRHGQQNLELEITASVTICQVINKACELNALQASLAGGITRKVQKEKWPTFTSPKG